ncbi:hypothetical protein OIO90_001082 [Microbotryomycetes sp. JL221]|nr:hypothetical protein OIO90_001082 [Microbotryomycetes sp. JL221]
MYDPALNTTIAERVDFSNPAITSYQVNDAAKFSPGPAFQLFLADPDDASIVYCESTVFSIQELELPTTSSSSARLSESASSTVAQTRSATVSNRPTAQTTAPKIRLI